MKELKGVTAQKKMIRAKMGLPATFDLNKISVTQACVRRLSKDRRLAPAGATGTSNYAVTIPPGSSVN